MHTVVAGGLAALVVGPANADPLLRLRRQGGEIGGSIESLAAWDARASQAEPPRTQFWLRIPL
jgi:hypothetical protein